MCIRDSANRAGPQPRRIDTSDRLVASHLVCDESSLIAEPDDRPGGHGEKPGQWQPEGIRGRFRCGDGDFPRLPGCSDCGRKPGSLGTVMGSGGADGQVVGIGGGGKVGTSSIGVCYVSYLVTGKLAHRTQPSRCHSQYSFPEGRHRGRKAGRSCSVAPCVRWRVS